MPSLPLPPSSPPDPRDFFASPNRLAAHYRHFRVEERLLLTGHSHQAWPDCGLQAQQQAWQDAARLVDDKWAGAMEQADAVRTGYARLLGVSGGEIALGGSTHDLLIRFLSALPLRARPRLLTTDGEFHTIRRQLDRLAEEGIEVARVPADPATEVAARLAAGVDGRTAAVLVSAVLFQSARIVPGLAQVQEACSRTGALLLVDAYHALNVVPFELPTLGLDRAYVTGGGYKYCQLGEGNAFLRRPPGCDLRPVVTGWFSEFAFLAEGEGGGKVRYADGPDRFAGATYDPASHYRGAAVFRFFEAQGLNVPLLREVSRHQIGLLARAFDALDLDPGVVARDREADLSGIAGFLVLESPRAATLVEELRRHGVWADCRGCHLRLGPAPYLSDRQLEDAIGRLGEAARGLSRRGEDDRNATGGLHNP